MQQVNLSVQKESTLFCDLSVQTVIGPVEELSILQVESHTRKKSRSPHERRGGGVNSTPHPHALSTQQLSRACILWLKVTPLCHHFICAMPKRVCPRHVHSLVYTATATCTTIRGTSTSTAKTSCTRSSRSTSCTLHSAQRRTVWSYGYPIRDQENPCDKVLSSNESRTSRRQLLASGVTQKARDNLEQRT